jgi:hypothetical protein
MRGRNRPPAAAQNQRKFAHVSIFQLHSGRRSSCIGNAKRLKDIVKSKLRIMTPLMLLLVAGSLFAGTHFSIGMGFGVPGYWAPPPPPVVAYAPPCPGPGYKWVGGYWYPVGPRYYWHAG